jgi:hypothetical protein
LSALLAGDPAELLRFLQRHRVDQLLFRAVREAGLEDRLPEALSAPLRKARRASAVSVLLQTEAAKAAAKALEEAAVDHLFFKGIQIGEELYGDAVLRPSADVDLLVATGDRERALAALEAAGFERVPQRDAPDYEVALFYGGAYLDLHHRLIQPERCRRAVEPALLAGGRERGGLTFPDPEGTLLIMLLNPAITDHVTERLIHPLDLDRYLRAESTRAELDPRRALDLLTTTGLRTAAWAMLEWTRTLLDTPVPPELERGLAPGPLRRRYLRWWLRRDPAHLYRSRPHLVRAGFSLLLHDRPGDAVAAVAGLLGLRGAGPITR